MPEQNNFTFRPPNSNLHVECTLVAQDSWQIKYVNYETQKTRTLDRNFSTLQMWSITDFVIDASIKHGIYQ